MDTPRTIFFIGKPGCGKGTQAKMLAEKTGWQVITAGAQFRAIENEDTPLGRKVKSEIDAGILAPHWFASYLYLKSFFSLQSGADVIFDGFNRKLPEAEIVMDSLRWLDRPLTVIHIQVSDESVRTRLILRKDIENRADDSAVDERLKEYHEYTEPVLELFRSAGVLIEVDGEPKPEEITVAINKALGLS
jgi:adenylate kinase